MSRGYTFETDSQTEVVGKLSLEEDVKAFSKFFRKQTYVRYL